MMRRFLGRSAIVALLTAGCVSAVPSVTPAATETVITVDASKTHQTFKGWEVQVLATVIDYIPVIKAFPAILQEAANDLGITRVRLTVTSGMEHPPGYGQQFIDGVINEGTFIREYAYNIINDNNDPNVANLGGFEFTLLDWRMDNIIMPFKKLLEARGEHLYLYLAYVDFGSSAFEHSDHPDEYAEFMLVMFDHLKSKYGVVPDGIDMMNEPDQTPWRSEQIGKAVAATGKRLAAAGYRPDFLVASTVDRGKAVSFFEDVIGVSGAKEYVTDLTYHCYGDSGTNSRQKIGDATVKYKVGAGLNECWNDGNNITAAQRDLKEANNTSWQEGPFNGTDGVYDVDERTLAVSLRPKTRHLRQYFRHIRPGAVRIDATTNDGSFDPIAFINTDDTWAVGIVAKSGVATVKGLPAGSYDVSYTTDSELDTHRPPATIAKGESLSVTMPREGTIMIVGKPVEPTVLPGGGGGGRSGGTPTGGRAVPRPR